MGTVRTQPEPATPETIWAMMRKVTEMQEENSVQLDKLRESQRESQREADRRMKEYQKEADRRQEEADRRQAETYRQMKERAERLDKQLGKLGGRFGEMVEYMVLPNLITKFHELGFVFEKAYQNATIKDKKNNIFAEIDITLENGDKVMIVEVKSKPTTEDITDHIERMGKVRAHADLHNDNRKYLGAVAGMVFNENGKTFAMKNGFYVIEPSGETFTITEPKGDYSPREW
jgi:hypothetical protein